MSVVAVAIIGSAVIGAGASMYSSGQSSKQMKQALAWQKQMYNNFVNDPAYQDAKRVAGLYAKGEDPYGTMYNNYSMALAGVGAQEGSAKRNLSQTMARGGTLTQSPGLYNQGIRDIEGAGYVGRRAAAGDYANAKAEAQRWGTTYGVQLAEMPANLGSGVTQAYQNYAPYAGGQAAAIQSLANAGMQFGMMKYFQPSTQTPVVTPATLAAQRIAYTPGMPLQGSLVGGPQSTANYSFFQ